MFSVEESSLVWSVEREGGQTYFDKQKEKESLQTMIILIRIYMQKRRHSQIMKILSFSKANRKPHIKEIQTAITTTNKQTIKQNRTLPSPFLALCLNSLLLDFCTVYQKTKHNFCCFNSTRSINMAVKVRVKVTSPVPESLSSVHSISLSHCLS